MALWLVCALGHVLATPAWPVEAPLRVAAAASLAPILEEVVPAFTRATGEQVRISFGASGLLARQMEQGAPFDVFLSADVTQVDKLVRAGLALPDTRAVYARGTLDLWWRADLPMPAPGTLRDLADPRFRRIALANPETAPYGLAAREALQRLGIWPAVQARVVHGENVQQALQFAQTGNAEVALVAHTLALTARDGHSLPVEPSLHAPLAQALVVLQRTQRLSAARAFADFLRVGPGRAMLTRHGLLPP